MSIEVQIERVLRRVRRATARTRKLAVLLSSARYRSALRHGVAAAVEHRAIPFDNCYRTVIDVGANRGQFASFVRHTFPGARLLCFEPLSPARSKLAAVLADAPRAELFPFALGAASSTQTMHISAADDSSSLLPIGRRQRELFPGTYEVGTASVEVRRLDDIVAGGDLDAPILLKIDVQGGELDVLRGAALVLEHIDEVLVETSFVELYAGQGLADDVWRYLHAAGFRCRGIWGVSYDPDGACVQGDLLFVRDPSAHRSPSRTSV